MKAEYRLTSLLLVMAAAAFPQMIKVENVNVPQDSIKGSALKTGIVTYDLSYTDTSKYLGVWIEVYVPTLNKWMGPGEKQMILEGDAGQVKPGKNKKIRWHFFGNSWDDTAHPWFIKVLARDSISDCQAQSASSGTYVQKLDSIQYGKWFSLDSGGMVTDSVNGHFKFNAWFGYEGCCVTVAFIENANTVKWGQLFTQSLPTGITFDSVKYVPFGFIDSIPTPPREEKFLCGNRENGRHMFISNVVQCPLLSTYESAEYNSDRPIRVLKTNENKWAKVQLCYGRGRLDSNNYDTDILLYFVWGYQKNGSTCFK